MNIILLITVTVTLALVHGQNKEPCKAGTDKDFNKKHILPRDLGEDTAEWKKYLMENTYQKEGKEEPLCGRVKTQSFIYNTEKNVREICHKDCRNVPKTNLCISPDIMTVYDVVSTLNGKDCKVEKPTCWKRKVVLACDVFDSKCQPVHYETKEEYVKELKKEEKKC